MEVKKDILNIFISKIEESFHFLIEIPWLWCLGSWCIGLLPDAVAFYNFTMLIFLAMDSDTAVSMRLEDETPQYPVYVGFIAAAVAVFFFSSNFLPVKKFETGDGIKFQ